MQFLYVNSTKLDIVHSWIISGRPRTPIQVVLCNTDHSISEISNHEGGKKKSHWETVYKNAWATTLKTVHVTENKISLKNFHSQKEVKEVRTRGNEVS